MSYTIRREGCPLGAVETWVFDLDNTLFPASCGLFPQVQARMNEYIARRLGVTIDVAKELRAQYFREHGATMHGLMAVHRVDPHEFMAFVHDVDLSVVPANPALVAALDELSGRKLIYTNGSVPHAENLLKHLGISHYFDDIFDIVASEFAPKPAMAPLRVFVDRYGVRPKGALMVEDMAKNLAPAAEIGMTTAWVRTGVDWAALASDAGHIHYVIDDLAGFLTAAASPEAARSAPMTIADTMAQKLTERFAPARLDDRRRFGIAMPAMPGHPGGGGARRRDAFLRDPGIRRIHRPGAGRAAAARLPDAGRRAGRQRSRLGADNPRAE